jgi:hypothetical protein
MPLKSYLHNRHFLLKVETEYTELSPVNAGVPQGSVLEPLLYSAFNHKRATAANCRESHHHRTDATAVPFRSAVV